MSRGSTRVQLPAPARTIRCAIYTRKSTDENLDNNFNSLDAQREAGLAFVATMRQEGWITLPERYDDGGFTGGNTERPALKRLLTDVVAGKVDSIIVYKIDRLSRSLLDFLRLIELFEQHQVAFVAVTQQINTATSAGKLMLHILASFASYERELISERTSDKMSAARRKGKWCGGPAILGYRVDREKRRLMVDPEEAAQVKAIFDLYLEHQSMLPVVQELNRRGWTTKSITYVNGSHKEGVAWNKARLYDVLTNFTYSGQVEHKGHVYPGEHQPIIDKKTFRRVQALLRENQNGKSPSSRNKHQALLKGLLKCGHCGSAMVHTYAKKGNRLYRYYACNTRMKQGRDACPTPNLPAQEIEDFVVEQIRKLARDPDLVRQVFNEASKQQRAMIPTLESERKRLLKDKQAKGEEIRRLSDAMAAGKRSSAITERLSELEAVTARIEERVREIDAQLASLQEQAIGPEDVAQKLAEFEGVWGVMHTVEQTQLVQSLIESIKFAGDGNAKIAFRMYDPLHVESR
jgi:site-specific DNA recombinase